MLEMLLLSWCCNPSRAIFAAATVVVAAPATASAADKATFDIQHWLVQV